MARIDPPLFTYEPGTFILSSDARESLRRRFAVEFSDADFQEMEEALAICESVWRTRKFAIDQKLLAKQLRSIKVAVATLYCLLNPTSGRMAKPVRKSERKLATEKDAVKRLRMALVDLEDGEGKERAHPDIVPALSSDLAFLESVAGSELAHVEGLDTLTQGGDSEHHEYLLKGLMPVAKRHDLQTSYTTPVEKKFDPEDDSAQEHATILCACGAGVQCCRIGDARIRSRL